jgi:Mrp family chromosome partitioning ATPase
MDSLSLVTKMNLVKVRSNLEEVRRRLELPATLPQIGGAVHVTDQRNTDLLVIRAHWSDPEGAMKLATTMSEVFLQSQVAIRYREEMTVIDRMLNEARVERARIQAQIDDLGRITNDLRSRVSQERESSPADEGLGQLSIRMSQLRDAINDDQGRRANEALLKQKQAQLERAEALREQGAMTDQEIEVIRAERDRLQALVVDTEQITEWRRELERLQGAVLPSGDDQTASAPLLQAVMFRALDAEFDLASARERVDQYDAVRDRIESKLEALDGDDRPLEGRSAPEWITESDFQIVTPARLPVLPSSSNRRVLAAAVLIVMLAVGVAVVLMLELLAPGFRSAPEMALRGDVPVLGAVPHEGRRARRVGASGPTDPRYRIVAQGLLLAAQADGARVLVTSADAGEGRTRTTARLAEALGGMGERVLVMEAGSSSTPIPEVTEDRPEADTRFGRFVDLASAAFEKVSDRLKTVWLGPIASLMGQDGSDLARLLQVSEAREEENGRPRPTSLPRVDYLPLVSATEGGSVDPARLSRLMQELSEEYRLVLIDGPAVLPDADAQRIAQATDGVVLVTRACRTPSRKVRTALNRLAECRSPVLGSVLNSTPDPFLDLD